MERTTTRRSFLASTATTGLSFTALSSFLAACSEGESENQTDNGAAGEVDGEVPSVAPITIVINESPWLDSFRSVADVYQDETGNVVDPRAFPFDAVRTQALNAVTQQSDEFDLFTLNEAFASEFYAAEVLEPLTNIDPSFVWPDGIVTYDNIGRWDHERGWFDPEGTIYGLPVNGNIQLFYYRRDLYEEYGLDAPPETWAEVLDIAEAHGTDSLAGYVLRPRLFDFMPILRGLGGDVFANAPDDLTISIDNDLGRAALETTLQLVSYGPRDPQSIEQPELLALFQAGQVLQGHGVAANYPLLDDPSASNVVDEVDYAVLPRPDDGEHASMTGMFVQAIPAHLPDEQKQAAFTFLRWLMTRNAQMRYAEAGGIVTHQGVYDSSLADDQQFRYMRAVVDSTEYLNGFTRMTFGAKIRDALDRRLQELFAGSLGIDDGLAQMRADLEGILDEEGLA